MLITDQIDYFNNDDGNLTLEGVILFHGQIHDYLNNNTVHTNILFSQL